MKTPHKLNFIAVALAWALVLGKHAVKREPRWSLIRTVLHWVE